MTRMLQEKREEKSKKNTFVETSVLKTIWMVGRAPPPRVLVLVGRGLLAAAKIQFIWKSKMVPDLIGRGVLTAAKTQFMWKSKMVLAVPIPKMIFYLPRRAMSRMEFPWERDSQI